MKRLLILEDGSVYEGTAFGADHFQVGELVFNTGMSGYQEVLSDLSYCGQIVMMTYPMIGNYGINHDDFESLDPAVFGFVVRECCEQPSNFRSDYTLDEFLKMKNIPGIQGVDTRAITRKLRTSGTMRAIMADEGADVEEIVKILKNTELMHDQVARVSTRNPFPIPNRGRRVVLMDFGAKLGIIRELSKRNCDLTVVPYDTDAQSILDLKPDGVMLSNGPGDPKDVPECSGDDPRADGQSAAVRHLPWPSADLSGFRRQHREAEVWPPRLQPSGDQSGQRQGRDDEPEPRLCGRGWIRWKARIWS